MADPLLDPYDLPQFDALTPEALTAALAEGLARYAEVVDGVVAARADTFETLWLPLEKVEVELDALWSTASHLNAMISDPALRAAFAAGEANLVASFTRTRQDTALFSLLLALRDRPDFVDLSAGDRAAVNHLIRDSELSGVALDPARRARYAELAKEASSLASAFSDAVVDATDAWSEHVADPAILAGMSEASLNMFAADARAKGLDGWLVTLQQTSAMAVLAFAEDRALRERVYRAMGTRASDQGPHAGQFDNSARIARILEIRREIAALLDFDSPVAVSLATKMATDVDEVLAFLRRLAARAKPAAEREFAELQAFASQELGLDKIEPWDVDFASNRLRLARYAVEEQAVRAYFPIDQVLAGWKSLLVDLFGLTLIERDGINLWSDEAVYYDVIGESGETIAGLYLDLHARSGKRSGAWMAPARPRLRGEDGDRNPVAYLNCNFAPNRADSPALLSQLDIRTLLHETGHCLHHLLTEVNRPRVAGVRGFEWDAIELPSQLLEDFAWDFGVLTRMSRHVETGTSLPRDLFDRLVAAQHFQAGMALVRHVEYSLFDMLLHSGTAGDDPAAVLELARDEVSVVRPPAWHRLPHSFMHIFAYSYGAGYYSYLWAEVLAADGFQSFVEQGGVSREPADRLRSEVLSRGATRPAAESFRAFRGRDPDPDALLVRRGLAA